MVHLLLYSVHTVPKIMFIAGNAWICNFTPHVHRNTQYLYNALCDQSARNTLNWKLVNLCVNSNYINLFEQMKVYVIFFYTKNKLVCIVFVYLCSEAFFFLLGYNFVVNTLCYMRIVALRYILRKIQLYEQNKAE